MLYVEATFAVLLLQGMFLFVLGVWNAVFLGLKVYWLCGVGSGEPHGAENGCFFLAFGPCYEDSCFNSKRLRKCSGRRCAKKAHNKLKRWDMSFFKMTLAIFWRYGCVCFPKLRDPPKETSVSHWMHHILRFLKGHLGRHTHLAVVYLPHQRIVRIERLGPRPDTKNGKQKDILVMGIMMVVLHFVTCMCCRGRHYTHSIVSHLLICIITHIIN